MKEEEEPSWFARWEEQLPSPDELMPLSQTLITPDLALAFDIPTPHHHPTPSPAPPPPVPHQSDFESPDLTGAAAAAAAANGGDEPARTLKRPRLVWTPQLHKRFVDAVAHLGIKNAVPKTIMQLMSVDGLTRENVASHLQKYRLYLKRMQGLSSSGGGPASGGAHSADDQLFASAPVPHHFLARGPASAADPFMSYAPAVAALQHHQMAAAAVAVHQQQYYHQQQQQQQQQRHLGHFGSPPGNGFADHGFLTRAVAQPGLHRMVGPAGVGIVQPPQPPATAGSYAEDLESGTGGGNRRVLTLFPTNED
ncbi:hypothetical protein J5N97_014421 [Dioscorea zingiberensis]|uniref:HTH myb-type domain-containing protein n=1 Tax=Dioscorea zingiberensis TaxID=325984 RepID=A0A9D5HK22_9LILI|nr:hypothetical protein J5N97_014421 [Dioscorea zingiberensis]